ncbi:MAG: sulfur oxidation c-type cytochrome SoxX [Hydrogenophilales bacterium CG03_land_8_20_14_0_80_62_28]|nr:sulfur oxidation c-type cytochrome SoxX [Betaproteobacteria bacterium]OIO77963.1 MAG: sulfur oxidation c-type cytochrome SoxX [Hydrogenophilaceae bacterium CG1_02_62_390]PIV23908.1 MAG: sulfur oxidation c-type cytochrome SoxX [Hydrogenophilales bacterium CG03_land_8_20_14_0_80_62_28]PIW39305.1 MAG: sulfur oxidation c-type cytochrome SoxX [Hydrogenophilales bacterium CG15_BIG_FIL_POST_REV_8_21_14_020_62_31]PIW72467.1 MAG: sulfur oxidation c-type cytochrome SoxX [Hydrogenophilales bacterium CG
MRNSVAVKTGISLLAALFVDAAIGAEQAKEITGKDLAYDNKKGNCLACHAMPTMADAAQPGNSGPPLIAMSARFPDKTALRAQIWDATARNPATYMPPFGKHKILSEQEIDKVVDFVYGL